MGSSTAFLTGFVDAANRNMYETRMAAHQESVEARADFQWKERNTEAIARQDKLIADNITLENQRLEDSRAFDITDAEREREEQEDRDKEELSKRLIALNSEFANNPEALAKALLAGQDGFNLYNIGARHDPSGRLMLPEEILDNDVNKYVRNSAPQYYVGREDEWMETAAARQFKDLVRAQGGKSGLDSLVREGGTFRPVYTDGVLTGAEVIYADPDMYEPLQFERDRLDIAFSTSINAINQLMPDLLLDKEGNILKGDAAIAINILRNRALKEYSRVRSAGQSVDESYLVNRVFEEFEALVPALAGDNKQRADNLINDTLYVDTIANMSGEELFLIHQNLGDRIRLSDNDIITPGSPANTSRMQAVGDAIEDNAMFKAYVGELEDEPVGAGAIVPPPLTGNPALDARNLREVEEAQQRAVVEADKIVTRTNNVVNRLSAELDAANLNITKQQERGAGDVALRPLFHAALAAQKEAVAAREAFSPLIAE